MTLQVDCDASLEVRTKRVYLKQTIENLLSNAVKYRDPENEDAQVTLTATVEDSTCHVAVADNGFGIDSQYRDRLLTYRPRAKGSTFEMTFPALRA
ncbi:MAG: ATP-binding protein [Planctomycetota bacterium]